MVLQVSQLFEEFYTFAKHYPMNDSPERLTGVFLKILEEFSSSRRLSLMNRKMLRNFLHRSVFLLSNSKDKSESNLETVSRYYFVFL